MWLSPAVILTIGSIMTFVSLLYSPETRGVELSDIRGHGKSRAKTPAVEAQAKPA
jgi:hypothetical protein